MERRRTTPEGFLSTPEVAKLLQIGKDSLDEIVVQDIVRPIRALDQYHRRMWNSEDIFRVFVAYQLVREFEENYSKVDQGYKYDEVQRDILCEMRKRGPRIIKSAEWRRIAREAKKMGLDLLDLKKIKLNGSLSPKNRY
jgi:hypothetical protein